MTASQGITSEQATLLDLSGREFNALWVDESRPLYVANNPLHWRAHKLQTALARMEKQQESSPQQFNATAYFAALDKLGELMDQINSQEKVNGTLLDEGRVAGVGLPGTTPVDGQVEPISMDS